MVMFHQDQGTKFWNVTDDRDIVEPANLEASETMILVACIDQVRTFFYQG